MTETRVRIFTFIAVAVVPLLFFALVEITLATLNVGTSYDFFNEIEINGEPHYQENPQFAHQFYPPSLNIGPLYSTFIKRRSPDAIRIYLLGGSAAMGYPHKNHGLDRQLQTLVSAALPRREVQVINTAMTSVNSHVVYEVARTLPADSADFAVVLTGNNEVVGPYGPGTFNQNFLSNLAFIRGLQALKRTRIWQALTGLVQQVAESDAREELRWEGMQMFTDHGVAHNDPRLSGVYAHYEDNLIDTIETLRSKGMHVLLSSVPVNLRHSAPFLSMHSPEMTKEQLDTWIGLDNLATESVGAQKWDRAIRHYKSALAIDPGYADSHFRIATVYEHLKQFDKSRDHYKKALDNDALRFRTDTKLNEIVRDVARRVDLNAFDFVDGAAAFEQASHPFQPGWNLFLEHVHYDFSGNYVLAAEMASAIVATVSANEGYQPLSQSEVARRTGFPNHETIDVMKDLLDMIRKPPFPGQSNFGELEAFVNNKIQSVTRKVGSPAEVVKRRQTLVASGVADWKVYYELAVLNKHLRDQTAADNNFNRVLELFPHNRESYVKLAEQLSRDGKWREVIVHLEQSLHYTRGNKILIAETMGWLGVAYFRAGKYQQATDILLEIIANYPDQVGVTLGAYGNLVRYSREQGRNKQMAEYVADVQDYAELLIRTGQHKEFPLLSKRMSQIMVLAGDNTQAESWARRQL